MKNVQDLIFYKKGIVLFDIFIFRKVGPKLLRFVFVSVPSALYRATLNVMYGSNSCRGYSLRLLRNCEPDKVRTNVDIHILA